MQIILGSDAAAALDDADNFRSFSIVSPADVPPSDLGAFVLRSGVGELDGDGEHVRVHIESIRRLASRHATSTWGAGFDAMIAYARTKGWVDDAGNTVRAHLESR